MDVGNLRTWKQKLHTCPPPGPREPGPELPASNFQLEYEKLARPESLGAWPGEVGRLPQCGSASLVQGQDNQPPALGRPVREADDQVRTRDKRA